MATTTTQRRHREAERRMLLRLRADGRALDVLVDPGATRSEAVLHRLVAQGLVEQWPRHGWVLTRSGQEARAALEAELRQAEGLA